MVTFLYHQIVSSSVCLDLAKMRKISLRMAENILSKLSTHFVAYTYAFRITANFKAFLLLQCLLSSWFTARPTARTNLVSVV